MDIGIFFIILLIGYTGSIAAKFLFYITNVKKSENINTLFVLTPFSTLFAGRYLSLKKLVTPVSVKKLLIIELTGILTFFISTLSLLLIITQRLMEPTESIFLIILNLFFVIVFLYFSIEDILRLKVSEKQSKVFAFAIVVISLVIGVYRFTIYRLSGEDILIGLGIGFWDNLLGGLVLGLIIYFFVRLNNSFGMVDVYLIFSMGLMLGFFNSIVALILISFIGALISVLYCIRIRKVKGIKIPFAPLMLVSYVVSLGYGEEILNFLIRL